MKIVIVYDSVTGNTEQLAKMVKEACIGEEIVYYGRVIDVPDEIEENGDLYFVGSWTNRGSCTKQIAHFCKKLKNKKVALFGTCGFGGSDAYFETLKKRFQTLIDDSNEMIGCFYCQGKMPITVRDRYVTMLTDHPDDKDMKISINNFDRALSHPDENDLQKIYHFAKKIIGK